MDPKNGSCEPAFMENEDPTVYDMRSVSLSFSEDLEKSIPSDILTTLVFIGLLFSPGVIILFLQVDREDHFSRPGFLHI